MHHPTDRIVHTSRGALAGTMRDRSEDPSRSERMPQHLAKINTNCCCCCCYCCSYLFIYLFICLFIYIFNDIFLHIFIYGYIGFRNSFIIRGHLYH